MVRKAKVSDLGEILRVMLDCITPPWNENLLRLAFDCADNDFFVYEDLDKIVGYIIIENVLDEGCVTSVAVAEGYRNKGIAKNLLKCALSKSKMNSVYLEVNERNMPAIALYASCGFEKVGERKKYYGDSSAIIMRREI